MAVLLGLDGKRMRTSLELASHDPEGLVEVLIQSIEKRESWLFPV